MEVPVSQGQPYQRQQAWSRNWFAGAGFPRRRVAHITARPRSLVTCASLSHRAEELTNDHTSTRPFRPIQRDTMRIALPSKGRMAEDTLQLLKDCQLAVYKPNPRQYVATIPQLPGLEVWFQRASDVVRKIKTGDVDLGIVGYDMFAELAGDDEGDLIVVHDALDFGHCKLALGIPTSGAFADISTLEQLKKMPQWSESRPLRVVTGYQRIARDFFSMKGFQNVRLVSADGALEAAPAMGSADIILDLVSTGVTLRENNLKEIEGGKVLESQGILVANRQSLKERPGLLEVTRELIERFEAHLVADGYYSVIANMHGDSMEDVAHKLNSAEDLGGLEGPTISPVYAGRGSKGAVADGPRAFAAVICIKKKELYRCVKELRKVGGRDVLVQPMTYIFDAEPERWRILQENLGLMGRC